MKFENIAKLIRENRTRVNMSQSELSEKLGYKKGQYISNCERGICSIPLKMLGKTADLLFMPRSAIKEAVLKDYEMRINERLL
jgi:transcriptional regulator with XRE-family HTH domain